MHLVLLIWLSYPLLYFFYKKAAHQSIELGLTLLNIISVVVGFALIFDPKLSKKLIGLILLWQVVSSIRIYLKRYDKPELTRRIVKTWIELSILMLIGIAILELISRANVSYAILAASAVYFLVSVYILLMSIKRIDAATTYFADEKIKYDLPTVTLAIPARNETHALTDSLRSAISSSYPKLEILVADDCSQDSTPDIIRSFAHDGVRFIQSEKPLNGWLGKNNAYESLAKEASGDIIIFSGVDVHLGGQAIEQIVKEMLASKADMISVIPSRRNFDPLAIILRPARYLWQFIRPDLPLISACWAIKKSTLENFGGFGGVAQRIEPERAFAQLLSKHDRYRIIASSKVLDVTTRKKVSSQFETAIRTLYPMLDRDPAKVLFYSIVLLMTVSGIVLSFANLSSLSLLAKYLFISGTFLIVVATALAQRVIEPRGWLLASISLPLTLLLEVWLIIYSMVAYEFGRVEWKGRNICLPTIKH